MAKIYKAKKIIEKGREDKFEVYEIKAMKDEDENDVNVQILRNTTTIQELEMEKEMLEADIERAEAQIEEVDEKIKEINKVV